MLGFSLLHPRARTQLAAVLRKNLLLTVRNKRDAAREFGMPVLLLGVLILLSNITPDSVSEAVIDHPTRTVQPLSFAASSASQVWLAPCTSVADTTNLAAALANSISNQTLGAVNVTCFPCEMPEQCGAASLLSAYPSSASDVFAAVIVDSSNVLPASTATLPVSYRIRMDRGTYTPGLGITNSTAGYGPDGSALPPDSTPSAWISSFLPMQYAVESGLTAILAGNSEAAALSTLYARQFPTPSYSINIMATVLIGLVPIYLTIIFTLQVRVLLTRILEEKERKIKITLKIMGLSDEMFWASWTITALIKNTVLVFVIVTVAVVGKLFPHSSFSVILCFFFLFELTCIAFCFAVTSLFSKSRTGGAVGMLIYIAVAAPAYALNSPTVPFAGKMVMGLLAPCAFNLGAAIITTAEQRRVGVQWATVMDGGLSPAGVGLGSLMCMLALDAALYLALAWYLDKVVPSEFGTTQHPLFCLGFRWRPLQQQQHGGGGGGSAATGGSVWQRGRGREADLEAGLLAGSAFEHGAMRGAATVAGIATAATTTDRRDSGDDGERKRLMDPMVHKPYSAGSAASPAAATITTSTASTAALAARSLLSETADVEAVPAEVAARPGVFLRGLTKAFDSASTTGGAAGARGGPRLLEFLRALCSGRRMPAAAAAAVSPDAASPLHHPHAPRARVAVDHLDLDIYEGQVTCLLGHNGAGKTTCVSMLTGLYAPTGGDARVYGLSVCDEMPAIRDLTGICPQHDVVFEQLSVVEHLQLYGGIKGLVGPELQRRIDEMVADLGLQDKRDVWAGRLSGGQKRRLSVAMAMIGWPKLLILDEPTSGLDPSARRQVWSMIQKHKAGRTIILTTHYMDEADILGDRIALMARGRLRVCGSSLYLKNKFGLGYHLTLSASPRVEVARRVAAAIAAAGSKGSNNNGAAAAAVASDSAGSDAVSAELIALVTRYVAGARFRAATASRVALPLAAGPAASPPPAPPQHQKLGPCSPTAAAVGAGVAVEADGSSSVPVPCSELTFLLPHDAVAQFPVLFDTLEAMAAGPPAPPAPAPLLQAAVGDATVSSSSSVAVLGFSVSIATLEEVFLRLSELVEAEEAREKEEEAGVATHNHYLGAVAPWGAESTAGGATASAVAGAAHGKAAPADAAVAGAAFPGPPPAAPSVSLIAVAAPDAGAAGGVPPNEASLWWWLDVRRRAPMSGGARCGSPSSRATDDAATEHGGGAAASPVAAAATCSALPTQGAFDAFLARLLPAPARVWRRGSWAFTWRQVQVQMWRRGVQLLRDPRAIWLQCVTPVLFVCVGLVFRLLQGIDASTTSSVPVPLSPAGFGGVSSAFSLPAAVLGPPGAETDALVNYTAAVLPLLPSQPATAAAPGVTAFPWYAGGPPATDADADSALFYNASMAAGALLLSAAAAPGAYDLTLVYNSTLTNGLPAVLSMWGSAVLGSALGMAANASGAAGGPGMRLLLQGTLDPLPVLGYTPPAAIGDYLSSALAGFYIALGYVTIPALQASNVVAERESRCKQQQLIMGSTPLGYWAATWLFDAVQYTVPWLGGVIITLATNAPLIAGGSDAGLVLTLLLLLYGLAIPGPTYLLSFLFAHHTDAQMWTRLGYSGLTVVLFFSSFALDFPGIGGGAPGAPPSPGIAALRDAVLYVGMLFPPFALAKGFADVTIRGQCDAALVAAGRPCVLPSAFSWDLGGAKLVFMALTVPVCLAALLAIEYRAVPASPATAPATSAGAASASEEVGAVAVEDDDVVAERRRIDALLASSASASASSLREGVAVCHLRKVFPASSAGAPLPKVAVADLSLQVRPGDVFGLLGANGAGKSTTISALVGELRPSAGTALVWGRDVTSARRGAMDLMGYCPQADSLFDLLTGAETLAFFAAVNGVPAEHLPALAAAALAALDLTVYADTLVRAYSGGNKRRLSLALAYVSAPLAVYLDECSTGVDPFARRRMFDVIQRARHGRATVMTTHVLEDADALCSRIGIMVEGRLACLGTSQHLKGKYGRGYSIEVHLAHDAAAAPAAGAAAGAVAGAATAAATQGAPSVAAAAAISALVASAAPGARLVEQSPGHLRFEAASVRLGAMFRALEGAKAAAAAAAAQGGGGTGGPAVIREYSVSQTTLEAVFLAFSRLQEEADERRRLLERDAEAALAAARYR